MNGWKVDISVFHAGESIISTHVWSEHQLRATRTWHWYLIYSTNKSTREIRQHTLSRQWRLSEDECTSSPSCSEYIIVYRYKKNDAMLRNRSPIYIDVDLAPKRHPPQTHAWYLAIWWMIFIAIWANAVGGIQAFTNHWLIDESSNTQVIVHSININTVQCSAGRPVIGWWRLVAPQWLITNICYSNISSLFRSA